MRPALHLAWLRYLGLALCLTAGLGIASPSWCLSEREEIEIGREMHQQILASIPVYDNASVQQYVARIGQKIASKGDRPELEYTFTVLDSPDINAFATPGGYVYLNRGLLAYLNSEAQLAAVLSHEIAHITERHASQQDWMSKTSSVASAILGAIVAIQTGSGAAGGATQDAASMAGTAMVRGYGRDMELEADRVGARFMHASGYDPQAMIEVIGILKDQESFMRLRSKTEGKQPVSYHGVFSTHPRNDQRLKEVIAAAGTLESARITSVDPTEFRAITEGMKFSEQKRAAAVISNRYYNARLGFTVAFPSDWKVVTRASSVLAGPNRDNTVLRMSVKRADATVPPEDFARKALALRDARDVETFGAPDFQAWTAREPAGSGKPERRVGAIYFGPNAYVFEGRTGNAALAPFYDSMFLSSMRSFRPMSGADRDEVLGIKLHYVRAPEGTTFSKLAETSPVSPYAEEQLRLVNGYYPNGEPETGTWIKVFR